MMGLILKDFYALRSYFTKQLGLMALVFLMISFATRTLTTLMPAFIIVAIMMLFSSFSVDETTQWNTYALTLPVSTRDIVRAKYVLFLAGISAVTLASIVVCVPLNALFFDHSIGEVLGVSGVICLMYLPVCCISIPLFIKFGMEKGRVYMLLSLLLPFFGTLVGVKYSKQMQAGPTPTQILLWIGLAVLACAVFAFVSYRISLKLFAAKEF